MEEKISDIFVLFLMGNFCHDKFLNELKNERGFNTIREYVLSYPEIFESMNINHEKVHYEQMVGYAFDWEDDYEFWEDIDGRWYDYFNKLDLSGLRGFKSIW